MKKPQEHSRSSTEQLLDEEFVNLLTYIEQQYFKFNKHVQIRIQKWAHLLLQCDQTLIWKKSRNNYIRILAEMVEVGWVGMIFSKMPPEKQIHNLSDSEYRRILTIVKSHKKKVNEFDNVKNNYLISLKKVAEPEGDFGDQVCTSEQTDPSSEEGKSQKSSESKQGAEKAYNQNQIEDLISPKQIVPTKNPSILSKTYDFLTKYSSTFSNDEDFQQIIAYIEQRCGNGEQSNLSSELRIQEGISKNRIHLFQFGSPRGQTQMQYFKAALQL